MLRMHIFVIVLSATIQLVIISAQENESLAGEWAMRTEPRGTINIVDLFVPSVSVMLNCTEGLVTLDRENNWTACLAKDWKWIDERTIDFKLREDVRFHNGEKFNALAVKINWNAYKRMENPRPHRFHVIPDETVLTIIDEYMIRFTFPEPDGLALVRFGWFFQIAPAFFAEYKFEENNWGYLPEAGPWGTGPFRFVEGRMRFAKPGVHLVLEAFEDYWDLRYPKVRQVIFDTKLLGNREKAMRLCEKTEGAVDIVSFIRPLDALKVAESPFAKVVKSKDVVLLHCLLNQRKKESKWKDIRLRQAVNFAINREELWKYAAKGNAYNLGAAIPPGSLGHDPDLLPYSYDTKKARGLLAQAGYPQGFELKMIAFEAWKLEAQIISRMLERIGLRVRLDVFKYSEYMTKIYTPYLEKLPEEQDWDIAIYYSGDWFGHAGMTFLAYYLDGGGFRWSNYDTVYEGMWGQVSKTVSPEEQQKKIREMMRHRYNLAYELYLYSPISLYAVNKEVNFVPQKLIFLRLKETSVTKNHWSLRGKNN